MKIAIDFEYNHHGEGGKLSPICVAVSSYGLGFEPEPQVFWLRSKEGLSKFRDYMEAVYQENGTLVSWAADAESKCLYALGLDPDCYNWIDLMIEYQMLLNENYTKQGRLGSHLIGNRKSGYKRKCFLTPERYELELRKATIKGKAELFKSSNVMDGGSMSDIASTGLLAAKYRIFGEESNQIYKSDMTELCISKNSWSESERKQIEEYCKSDIDDLPRLDRELEKRYHQCTGGKYIGEDFHWERVERGFYQALTGIMVADGYPIYTQGIRNVIDSKKSIMKELTEEIDELFPLEGYSFAKKPTLYKKAMIEKYMKERNPAYKDWPRKKPTANMLEKDPQAKGNLELSKDVLEKRFGFSGRNANKKIFGEMLLNHTKTNSDLGSLDTLISKESMDDGIITADNRAHPRMNAYGTKTSRSSPRKGYLFSRKAWMRQLCFPKKDEVIIGIDYGSQEFLLQALISECDPMIDAYESGDVYLSFAKQCDSTIPKDATKHDLKGTEHEHKRDQYKSAVLGIGYGMGAKKLGLKITEETGILCTEINANRFIDKFNKTYREYYLWKKRTVNKYHREGHLRLKDGWTLFGGRARLTSERTITNFPIQGGAAVIMRRAVEKMYECGLKVLFTQHDAIYISSKPEHVVMDYEIMYHCMKQEFQNYFKGTMYYERAGCIRLDPKAWSPAFDNKIFETKYGKLKVAPRFKDERDDGRYDHLIWKDNELQNYLDS